MNKVIVTSIALAMSTSVSAQLLEDANEPIVAELPAHMVVMPREELQTEDVVMGAGIGTAAIASMAAAAAPAVVAHSSGMAIMWSGTGYVAGTIGLGAATVAALPVIAAAGAVTAGGAYAYKHRDAIAEKWNYYFGEE
jgi:hypothetical protein